MTVHVNAWAAAQGAFRAAASLKDARPVLRDFYAYHVREIDSVFTELGQGGTHRDLTWDGWSPYSYGRRRPSGRLIGPDSKLLQDTGRARQDATSGYMILSPDRVQYGPSIFYADEIYDRRSPYSFTEQDRAHLAELFRSAAAAAFGGQP